VAKVSSFGFLFEWSVLINYYATSAYSWCIYCVTCPQNGRGFQGLDKLAVLQRWHWGEGRRELGGMVG
jgi:hypothetical protein